MCHGRHHPIKTSRSGKLGIAYCLLGTILLFLGCARQDDTPFSQQLIENNQALNVEALQEDTTEVVHPDPENIETTQVDTTDEIYPDPEIIVITQEDVTDVTYPETVIPEPNQQPIILSAPFWLPTDTRRDRKMYALHHDLKTGQLERW